MSFVARCVLGLSPGLMYSGSMEFWMVLLIYSIPFHNIFTTVCAKKVKPPKLAELFDIRQHEIEPLKDYLNRFCDIIVKINPLDEKMFITPL